MDEKTVSVIIPVYNAEKYLAECLESVQNQTYHPLQIILIEDGSSDQSGKICDEYAAKDERIEVYHQPNSGVSAARNKGLMSARGGWIAFIDADDRVAPDYIERLIGEAEKSGADIVC
ncbi:MAG: glycosyltransferase family 2 protein, partial [Acutalibacteraceae bacterium]